VELHFSVDVLPPAMLAGEALSDTVGATSGAPLLLLLLLLLLSLLPPPHAARMRAAPATMPMFTEDLKGERASAMRAEISTSHVSTLAIQSIKIGCCGGVFCALLTT
jgi:hypothetical protein